MGEWGVGGGLLFTEDFFVSFVLSLTMYYSPLNKIGGENFLRNFISTLFKTKQKIHTKIAKRDDSGARNETIH